MKNYQYVYVMNGVSKSYGNKQVLKDISLSFFPGAKIGVIGYNGAGKSTLLKIMAGIDKDITGESWAMEGIKVGYLPQEPKLENDKTVYENIIEALKDKKELLDRFNEISAKFGEEMTDDEMNDLIMEQGELQEKIDAVDAWSIDRELDIAMDALRCPDKDAIVKNISGGEKRRVAICKLLLEKPDMLLLDEPTNHLDAESVAWLENYLKNYSGTVVLITHDRYFLDNVTEWILELDRGEGVPWKANYSSWLEQKSKKLEDEQKQDDYRKKQLDKELDWIKQSPKARQAKNKARIKSYESLRTQERDSSPGAAKIIIPEGQRLGSDVLEVNNITKAFGDRMLIEDLSFKMPAGAIIGVIGANGVGKSTLFKMITGDEKPDSGEFKVGDTVDLGFIDQSRESLDDSKSVWEEISGGLEEMELGNKVVKSRAYCSAFNFKGGDQQKLVGKLSGGERNRVHLAKMLKKGANVILLDEPTNDLDVDTLRALEEALLEFSGSAVIISHDRWFLDRLATHILAYEGDSHVEWFEGNFTEYEEDKKRRLGAKAIEQPKRIKFKKFAI